jgi:hypothetical protein
MVSQVRRGAVGLVALVVASAGAAACREHAAEVPPPVARAVAVVSDLRAHPGASDSVLAAHGLDARAFDSLLYAIAEDPALADAYTRAIHGTPAPSPRRSP